MARITLSRLAHSYMANPAKPSDYALRPDSDRLRLRFIRSKPFPFPPEPLRTAAIWVMQRELARADANHGRRGALLRTFDWLGLGFDS